MQTVLNGHFHNNGDNGCGRIQFLNDDFKPFFIVTGFTSRYWPRMLHIANNYDRTKHAAAVLGSYFSATLLIENSMARKDVRFFD